ncbi:O-antigen ligase family protein [Williamsia sp. SKLECPSW1]
MYPVTDGGRTRLATLGVVAVLLVGPLAGAAAVLGGKLALIGVVGLAGLAVGAYIGLRHPMWLFYGLAVTVGFLPFGVVPLAPLPLYLVFGGSVVLAAAIHPSAGMHWHPLERTLLVLVAVSAVSVVFTALSISDYVDYVKWALVTLAVIGLLRLSLDNMRRVGVVFVVAAAFNALVGIAIFASPGLPIRKVFSPFGYGIVDATTRYVYNAQGVEQSARLGGMWVEPNAAGIGLLTALCVCLVVIDGWRRWTLAALFFLALVLTLSRGVIVSVVLGALLVMVFHTMGRRLRAIVAIIGALALVAAAATPQVRNRLLQSFVGQDVSSSSRQDALKNFPHQLAGHWFFGLGWARPEFKDGALAFQVNYVANAPLLTVYRGGLFAGLAFVAVLIAGIVVGWRLITGRSLPRALVGGIFIGFCFVGLQLDHPVVATLPVTTTFSMLLAFLVHADRLRRAADPPTARFSEARPWRRTAATAPPHADAGPAIAAR